MRLHDLLLVMREEFASAADDIDAGLMAWLGGDPAQAGEHAMPIAALFERLADTARVISLEGHAVALGWLRDTVAALTLLDEVAMGEGLGWLVAWRGPLEACFAEPGHAGAAQDLIDYLAAGPMPPADDAIDALRALLAQPAALPDGGDEAAAPIAAATAGDVSLEVPADVDAGLYEAFLAEAPDQLARLGDAVRALARAPQPVERLVEAQRVAHTFKGSGNIIGIRGVARLAHRIEDVIEFAIEQGGQLPAAIGRDLEQATATLDQMVYALRGEEEPPQDALARLQALLDWTNALHDGSWAERAADAMQVASRSGTAAPAAAASREDAAAAESGPATVEPQLRVDVSRLERLVRRGGQALVQGGRVDEHLRVLEDRLAAIDANNQLLRARLRELETALERQGVNLKERADEAGGDFDALEMDRYNELHALSRFVTEMVADGIELAQASRAEVQVAQATHREHALALKEQHRELLGARLVPFRQIGARLRRNVSQTAAATGKRVRLEIEGEAVQLDSDVLERLTEPLLHLLRNAVDHGIELPEERALYGKDEEGVVRLRASRDGQTVRIECRDDGRGLDLAAIQAKSVALGLLAADVEPDPAALMQMILLPGFSTRDEVSEVSGRGVGMDVVADRLRAMKGHIDIASQPLEGSCFTLRVPATTGSTHALVVRCAGELVAIPSDVVLMALAADQGERREARLVHAGHDAALVDLADWLGLARADGSAVRPSASPVVLVRLPTGPLALQVDAVLDARELILQDVGLLLRRVQGVSGGALRPDGRVMFLVDVEQLSQRRTLALDRGAAARLRRRATVERRQLLVVDDALSVRKALAQLLEDAGYQVTAARDGFEALEAAQRQRFELVLTDLEMPNLNGLDLTRQLRQQAATRELPVLMITSRSSDKHRASAAEAGVTHYLTKPTTDADLLAQVQRLLAGVAAAQTPS